MDPDRIPIRPSLGPLIITLGLLAMGVAAHEEDMLGQMPAVVGLPGVRPFTPEMVQRISWMDPLDERDWRPAGGADHMRRGGG
jgi:hypothetical protein